MLNKKYKNYKINCLILARKNSKRIKGKNLIKFKGKPLIYWTIYSAFKSNIFDKIIVSSDWQELLSFCKLKFKNLILDNRPKDISNSQTSSETVLKYLYDKYPFDIKGYTVLLQPTSPLRKTSYIRSMIQLVIKRRLNTLHSVSELKNKTYIKKDNNFYNLPKKKKKLFLNGSIYIFSNQFFMKKNKIKEKIGNYYFHHKKYSLDLDTLHDLKKLKIKYHISKQKKLIINGK